MNLRLRLIVAFFLLSIVPLGAITLYMYTSNARAMREAAGHEAQMLAGELTQRMQVVMAQLSQGLDRLLEMSNAETAPATPVPAAPRASATPGPAAPAPAASLTPARTEAEQMAAALGNMAMLIDNIEIRGARRGGRGRGPDGGGGGGRNGFPGGRGGPPPDGRGGGSSALPTTTPSGLPGQAPALGDRGTDAARGGPGDPGGGRPRFPDGSRDGGPGGGFNGRSGAAPDSTSRGTGTGPGPGQGQGRGPRGDGGPPPQDPNADPNRIRIDLAQIRRELFDELVPDRAEFDKLSPEERQRIFADIEQRMRGVSQGIEVLKKEISERAAEAKIQEAAQQEADAAAAKTAARRTPKPSAKPAPPAAAVETRAAGAPTGTAPAPAPTAPVPPTAPGDPNAAPAAPADAPVSRRSALSGSRLNVRVEQNGQILSQANAEVNLPNLLATVFTTTRRERGEVPFAVAKDGQIYTPTDADRLQIQALGGNVTNPSTPPGTTVLENWIVVTTSDPTGSGLKFGIARPVGEALGELQRTSARNAGLGLGLIGLALIGIVPISSRLTRNLSRLSDGVRRLAQGDYHTRVEVGSNDEIGRLARAFNQMAADVEKHQRSAVEQERLRRELELGRQIQHDMQPQVPLRLGLTEVKGVSVPAREVGGDFFNYFQTSTGTVALVVGDVSGKGVGAALLMMNIQASLRTRLALGQDLASIARELDDEIEATTPGPVYATLFVGVFYPETRQVRYVNAGHNPQYVLRRGGGLERMESTGLPIGLLAGRGYTENSVQLAAGDLIFFYTDGCVEAENAQDEMFGVERLEALLLSGPAASADDVLIRIENEITRFRAGRELFDDATMMVLNVG
ncbi:MAG: SpoIIE family protein phosphatase [Vicinamibacterales bacterium]